MLLLLPLIAALAAPSSANEPPAQEGGAELAIEPLEEAVKASPHDPGARFILAAAYFRTANVQLSDPLAPPPPPLLPGKQRDDAAKWEEYFRGERRLAAKHYREFLTLSEGREGFLVQRWAAFKNLLTLFTADPELPLREGRRYADAAESACPENAVMLLAVGRFYGARGDGAEAERVLRRVLDLRRSDTESCLALASAYAAPIWPDRPRSDEALALVEHCATANRRDPAGLVAVAEVAWACAYRDTWRDDASRDKLVERGLAAAHRALALNPRDKGALVWGGLLYRIKAQLAPAPRRIEYLNKAMDLQDRARKASGKPTSAKKP